MSFVIFVKVSGKMTGDNERLLTFYQHRQYLIGRDSQCVFTQSSFWTARHLVGVCGKLYGDERLTRLVLPICLEEKSGRAIGVSSIYFNLAKVSHLDTDSDYCPKPHTPSLDSDSEMSLCHYLAAAALGIPTNNHTNRQSCVSDLPA